MPAVVGIRRRVWRSLFAVLVATCGLSACTCTQPNELESNALYRIRAGEEPNYALPIDTWTRNPRLEAFIQKTIEENGAQAVIAKYRLQCSPRPTAVSCTDCFICSDSFRDYRLGFPTCVDYGTMLMHLEIGPGSKVAAMTYWTTTREARTPWPHR
jgi:hypothetical protein